MELNLNVFYRGFQDITPTDQNTFPLQHWNVTTFHEKNPNFRINPFTSQFYAKCFITKTLRSALKRPLKITKFVINIPCSATIW